jgi:prepilin-type processing-associated H-X9-DG protein
MAAMEAPADTILGTIDLPCGRVALYADGHVKSLPAP